MRDLGEIPKRSRKYRDIDLGDTKISNYHILNMHYLYEYVDHINNEINVCKYILYM